MKLMQTIIGLAMSWVALGLGSQIKAQDVLPLNGAWNFALDREDKGITERWFDRQLADKLNLPGSLQEQGFGDLPSTNTAWIGDLNDRTFFTDPKYAPYRETANFKFPYWLTPTRHYSGAAWYQREVVIPAGWQGKRVVLQLERPHWQTTVWVDTQLISTNVSLAAPHEYELTTLMSPGKHRLTIRVDNRYLLGVGANSHSVSDQTQGNWNGIAGRLYLAASGLAWIDNVQVYPSVAKRAIKVQVEIRNASGESGQGTVALAVQGVNGAKSVHLAVREFPVQWTKEGGRGEWDYELGAQAPLWDEFNPAFYRLTTTLHSGAARLDSRQTAFGLREVGVADSQITINGRPVFLRGTLECCIFPLTGYPPTDVDSWKKVYKAAQAHGLNHFRFHSWTPPEAALDAADELGIYCYVECPTWANQGATVGDGAPVDAWIYQEGDRILKTLGNHPSFILMSYGNEPAGRNMNRWLGDLVNYWKGRDPRRLYTCAAGWPRLPENQVHVTPDARAFPVHARLGETKGDYSGFLQKQKVPVLSHEIGQYCVFPNLDEIPKYRGWLRARNFEIVSDFLSQHGLRSQARDFLLASGRFQTLFYKDEIEACLRTAGWGGFQLLDLHDFPGQGTALVGVLDPFWEGKGYVKPSEYRRFCDETVPLARLPKRIFTSDETVIAAVEVAHFGARDLPRAVVSWRVRDARNASFVAWGKFEPRDLPTGKLSPLGEVRFPLTAYARRAGALNLEVRFEGARFANDWNLWVYPAKMEEAPAHEVLVTSQVEEALTALATGRKVVLLARPASVTGKTVGRFDPIFWNKMWFPTQPQHTLGLLMDPKHPALAQFPTASHSDWQWQDPHNQAKPMVLDSLPADLRPIVQVIDDWNTCRKLGLVFEAKVGAGSLLVCSIDLEKDLATRPAARQLRQSLLAYTAGNRFQPKTSVVPETVRGLFRELTATEKLGVRVVKTDSQAQGFPPAQAIDGDPATLWHTAWDDGAPNFPHELVLGWDQSATLKGVRLTPRQDRNPNGMIKDYMIHLSLDGTNWGEPVAKGALRAGASTHNLNFSVPKPARFLKLTAVSSFDASKPYASLAEIEFLVENGNK